MSSSRADGVPERNRRNLPTIDYNENSLQRRSEGGSSSQANAAAAGLQGSHTKSNSLKKKDAHTDSQSPSVQPQSKPSYSPQEEQQRPEGSSEAVAEEPIDQPMPDREPEREASDSSSTSSQSDHIAANGAEPHSPTAVGINDSQDEVLVDLKKLSIGRDHDGEPDAWSRLGRSVVLLVRYGPYKAAKYRVQSSNGYNTKDLQKVSSLKTRISHVMYEGENSEDHYRYSRNNVVGIVGVAFQETNYTNKEPKKAPTAYIKVKWEGIDAAHQWMLTNNTCWITKTDLVRLTDLATAEQKISEAWDKQEERYNHWQGQKGRDSPDRSPSPCPLDDFKAQKAERIKRENTRQPSMPIPESLEQYPEVRTHRDEQPRTQNNHKSATAYVKQELDEDNDLFVDNSSADGQSSSSQNANNESANGQNSNVQYSNRLNNDTSSASGLNPPPPKISKFYKKWLRRADIEATDLKNLDDAYFARFEAAAFVYVNELRKKGYVVEDDMDMDI
ncbi:uncharacterized protein N7511_000849 [Penicillium nucicola]|uniref:uncharacterized protein n=1 Tax=Penicillium nucicola TaxID=1850975 RepID=UPI0025455D21|nr:uncharacterized protein N7511_000849 [Penicillium nucicola]KAJ5775838.1 hypothetical protein N7511_000849 [Penicillium nucicola]